MTAQVLHLPTTSAVDAAWSRYVSLVLQRDRQPALAIDMDHNVAIARAWSMWRDLFLAGDRR